MKMSLARRAFTLLELMISIGLGSLVVYVATSGVRVASQTISKANRLAIENSIIRAGFNIALVETDLWLSYDNPFSTGSQSLRPIGLDSRPTPRPHGLPFTPFKEMKDSAQVYKDVRVPQSLRDSNELEKESGWHQSRDPRSSVYDNNRNWLPHLSRTWAWGNLAETASIKNPKRVRPSQFTEKRQLFGEYYYYTNNTTGNHGTLPAHGWHQRQLDGLNRTLGFVGLFDYVPANVPLMIYERDPVDYPAENGQGTRSVRSVITNKWTVSREWCYSQDSNANRHFYLGNYSSITSGFHFASDLLNRSAENVFVLPRGYTDSQLAPSLRQLKTNDLTIIASKRYHTGSHDISDNDRSEINIKDMLEEAELSLPWLDNRPEIWPGLEVSSLRHVRNGAQICLNRITWTDPVTGLATTLSFNAFGTTLRGARQMRHRDEERFADPFKNEPNLDTY